MIVDSAVWIDLFTRKRGRAWPMLRRALADRPAQRLAVLAFEGGDQLFGQVVHVNFQTADLRQECVADDRNFQTFHDPKP